VSVSQQPGGYTTFSPHLASFARRPPPQAGEGKGPHTFPNAFRIFPGVNGMSVSG
jgi:hypothetical protein